MSQGRKLRLRSQGTHDHQSQDKKRPWIGTTVPTSPLLDGSIIALTPFFIRPDSFSRPFRCQMTVSILIHWAHDFPHQLA